MTLGVRIINYQDILEAATYTYFTNVRNWFKNDFKIVIQARVLTPFFKFFKNYKKKKIKDASLRLISSVLKVLFLVWKSCKSLFSIDKDGRKNLIIGGQKAVLVQ